MTEQEIILKVKDAAIKHGYRWDESSIWIASRAIRAFKIVMKEEVSQNIERILKNEDQAADKFLDIIKEIEDAVSRNS